MSTYICRSCRLEFEPEQLVARRCPTCQVSFDSWLRGESPEHYQPRRDGIWRDIAPPAR